MSGPDSEDVSQTSCHKRPSSEHLLPTSRHERGRERRGGAVWSSSRGRGSSKKKLVRGSIRKIRRRTRRWDRER